jgi:endonuclease/exonuclease/phosphatase family metal-dependent hydrolase
MKFRSRKTLLWSGFVIVSLMVITVIKSVSSHSNPKSALSQGEYAADTLEFDGTLKVVTWNLHHGEHLEEIIAILETTSELQDADILLFQEIDAEGTNKIAEELQDNFVYAPAIFNRRLGKDHGNAILSKWSLRSAQKIDLPNWFPPLTEERNAAYAITSIGGMEIAVYSAHLDLLWMDRQAEFVAKETLLQNKSIIFGGDFNTWRPASIGKLENIMEQAGLERLTSDSGYTVDKEGIHLTLDHIFSIEELEYTSGVYYETNASDHYPLWVDIQIPFEE